MEKDISAFEHFHLDADREIRFKSREKLIDLPIDDFLGLTLNGFEPERVDALWDVVAQKKKFSDIPFLLVNHDGEVAQVTGFEGRHRARFLLEMGYTHMPVLLVMNPGRTGQSIRWSEQSDPKRFDYVDEWPQILRGMADAGQIPHEISFPVARENAVMPYQPMGEKHVRQIQEEQVMRVDEVTRKIAELIQQNGTTKVNGVLLSDGREDSIRNCIEDAEKKGEVFWMLDRKTGDLIEAKTDVGEVTYQKQDSFFVNPSLGQDFGAELDEFLDFLDNTKIDVFGYCTVVAVNGEEIDYPETVRVSSQDDTPLLDGFMYYEQSWVTFRNADPYGGDQPLLVREHLETLVAPILNELSDETFERINKHYDGDIRNSRELVYAPRF